MAGYDILKIKQDFYKEAETVKSPTDIFNLRVKYLGRKGGILTKILRSLKDLSDEEKRKIGPEANAFKKEAELFLDNKEKELKEKVLNKNSFIDVSRPGKKINVGHLHPLTKVYFEIGKIFSSMGFEIVEGPEIETEWYNFDALNIPSDHPARDMWDTIWLKTENKESEFKSQNLLLRTHTSPVQIRYMENHRPPIKIISPGKVYRHEATDASHDFEFNQLEGLLIDKNISVANFKYVIEEFFKRFFRQILEIRFRPSYFPFVEPGFEIDLNLNGKWLEMMGAGMVHPQVLENAGLNSSIWQGFAFGMGIERLAMIKYKIPDIRLFRAGDLRFIRQF